MPMSLVKLGRDGADNRETTKSRGQLSTSGLLIVTGLQLAASAPRAILVDDLDAAGQRQRQSADQIGKTQLLQHSKCCTSLKHCR
jgi:hypothetical protein